MAWIGLIHAVGAIYFAGPRRRARDRASYHLRLIRRRDRARASVPSSNHWLGLAVFAGHRARLRCACGTHGRARGEARSGRTASSPRRAGACRPCIAPRRARADPRQLPERSVARRAPVLRASAQSFLADRSARCSNEPLATLPTASGCARCARTASRSGTRSSPASAAAASMPAIRNAERGEIARVRARRAR